ncbi:MAG: hypothetical protein WAO98_01665 [Alphaproteobacteria bacterium]
MLTEDLKREITTRVKQIPGCSGAEFDGSLLIAHADTAVLIDLKGISDQVRGVITGINADRDVSTFRIQSTHQVAAL